MSQPSRLHAVVHGRVQGVGFRDFVVSHARTLGVTGFVRNLHDGSVEFVAEGATNGLRRLLAQVREGPRMSHVDTVDEAWMEATGDYAGFRITG